MNKDTIFEMDAIAIASEFCHEQDDPPCARCIRAAFIVTQALHCLSPKAKEE